MRANHPVVEAVGRMHFEGNVIPHNWYKHIKLDSGKPDLAGIIILSEIVYWYRPAVEKDEASGRVIGMKKRFKADLLQRTYDSFSEQFGLTKRQAQDAMGRLEALGLVKRHLRTIMANGTKLGNVLFIELMPEMLEAITFDGDPSNVKKGEVSRKKEKGVTLKRETNTESTTKNTTETTQREKKETSSSPSSLVDMNFLKIKQHYEQHMIYQPANYQQSTQLADMLDNYQDTALIIEAMNIAIKREVISLNYINGILKTWRSDGVTNLQQLQGVKKLGATKQPLRDDQATQSAIRATNERRARLAGF